MTTPVTSSTSVSTQNPLSGTTSTRAPAGISSEPSSLSSAASNEAAGGDYWQSIKGYASSFSEFIRKIAVNALEGLRSGLGVVVGWFGSAREDTQEPSGNWHIPDNPGPLPATSLQDAFSALAINDIDQRKIFTLIHTMGGSWWTLITKRGEMEQIGREIQNVHPLKFIDYIFRHPTLPKDMESIGKSNLTWNPFIEGLAEKLRREAATLPACKIGFARSLNVNLVDIDPYFSTSNWEGLVRFLIEVKLKRKTSVFVDPNPNPSTAITVPATSSTTTQTETTTTDIGPSLTPTETLLIANLPFESADDEILTTLLTQYAEKTRMWLMWNQEPLAHQWGHVGQRHPLRLLACLYTKPALMNHLQTIFQYWGTKSFFMSALTQELSRLPIVEVRPYQDDFAQICQLDPTRTKLLIQYGDWNQLIEDLLQNHQARSSS